MLFFDKLFSFLHLFKLLLHNQALLRCSMPPKQ